MDRADRTRRGDHASIHSMRTAAVLLVLVIARAQSQEEALPWRLSLHEKLEQCTSEHKQCTREHAYVARKLEACRADSGGALETSTAPDAPGRIYMCPALRNKSHGRMI